MPRGHDHLMSSVWESYKYRENVPRAGLMAGGRPALTGIDPQSIGEYVLVTVRDPLCGYDDDPARVLSSALDDPHHSGSTQMFSTWTGQFKGASVSVVSGGSGAPEAELAMHEFLEHTDASTYIRVGGSGGMHPSVNPGDIVIASGVARDDGLTREYVPDGWPAICSIDVVRALTEAAERSESPYHVGLVRSASSDIVGGGRPGVGGYMQPRHAEIVDQWTRVGVLNGDRESSAIVTMATLFGRRAGSICSVADNISTGAEFAAGAGHTSAMNIALEGVGILHKMDLESRGSNPPFSLQGLGNY